MGKRHSVKRSSSKRLFSSTAGNQHVHKKNMFGSGVVAGVGAMRGGIRL